MVSFESVLGLPHIVKERLGHFIIHFIWQLTFRRYLTSQFLFRVLLFLDAATFRGVPITGISDPMVG
jgi:hypothetical protein